MALEDSTIVRKAFKTEKEIHIALGFLLGCLISALITYIEAEWSLVEITLQGLWQVHLDTPACWIADTAPFAIAFFLGMEAGKLTKLIGWLHRRMSGMSKCLFAQHLKGVRLLLVEDNEINMDLATELLEEVGASVDAAVNGIMAVEMAFGQRGAAFTV